MEDELAIMIQIANTWPQRNEQVNSRAEGSERVQEVRGTSIRVLVQLL